MGNHPQRYACLDAWRGIAALSVLVFHCGNAIVDSESLPARLLLSGWLGVFIFFPISGYCILAALNSPHNGTIGAFLARRWRRIVPPYWASIAVTVGIGLAALPFNRGSVDEFMLPAPIWASVLTLTQVFTTEAGRINPVYWSLCFEEQFYLIMAMLLLAPLHRRGALLGLLTGVAAIYISPAWTWRVPGLFLQYWLCFAAGCGAYLWLHVPADRRWAILILGLTTLMGLGTLDTALLISAGTAIAIAGLARYDEVLGRTTPVAVLMGVGTFSFSLYLVHVPVGGRVTNLLNRTELPAYIIVGISCAISLAAAWIFYLIVEKRTLRTRVTGVAPTPQPAAVVAAV